MKNSQIKPTKKLVFGVGINDSSYKTQKIIDGVKWICPYYLRWKGMLKRCYSDKYQLTRRSYSGCFVCNDWLTFSKFRSWMVKESWLGMDLDKDLIKYGNKEYSPDKCCFIPREVNSFISTNRSKLGGLLTGVKIDGNRFSSQCRDPFTGLIKAEYGFKSEMDAHLSWKAMKHEAALCMASKYLYFSPELQACLSTRYS